MAIDIQPKKKKRFDLPSSFDVLFYYSLVLLLFSVSGYLLLSQWRGELDAQIGHREEVMSRLEENEEYQKNREIVSNHRELLDDYTHLFWERKRIDDFFLLLEEAIHPTAQLTTASMNIDDLTMSIEGNILNFEALEQQYTILKEFETERSVLGWVKEEDISEEGGVYTLSESVDVFRSPAGGRVRTTVAGREGEEVEVIKRVSEDEYLFESGTAKRGLIEGDWYEVRLKEVIKPIEEVAIDSMSETDERLEISFNFNIKLNETLFKP